MHTKAEAPNRLALSSRWMMIFTGTFIFVSPFPRITSIKEICFYFAVLLMLPLVFDSKKRQAFKTPLTLPFALFAGWAFLGLFFAIDKSNSSHDFYAHLLKYILLFFLLIHSFNTQKRLIFLSWIIVASATLFSIVGLVYYYVILDHPINTRFGLHLIKGRDFFGESPTNLMGVLFVFAIILTLQLLRTQKDRWLKIISALGSLPLFTATLLTQTRGSLVAMIVGIFILFINKRKIMLVLVSIIVVLVMLTPIRNRITAQTVFGNERIGLMLVSFEILKEHPIIGTGFGLETYDKLIDQEEYNKRLPEKYRLKEDFAVVHNMYFNVAMRLGVIGLSLFLFIIWIAIKNCFFLTRNGKNDFIKNWSLCALSVLGMFLVKGFFSPVFSHFTEVILFTIFSIITIIWNINSKVSEEILETEHDQTKTEGALQSPSGPLPPHRDASAN